ncbi:hypothetical protein KEM54_002688 [Ascosphaera aggregata]|nr:hypothetical protein KEM54_002688 [Ascosphaera aggregata]
MKFSTVTALTVLAGVASARIDAFTVPKTIKAGEEFEVTLVSHGYIQSMYEIAAAFGLSSFQSGSYASQSLQIYLDSVYLGPETSNTYDNYTFPIIVPKDTKNGVYAFTIGLFELVGALNSPSAGTMSANVTVGDKTSGELVYGGYA